MKAQHNETPPQSSQDLLATGQLMTGEKLFLRYAWPCASIKLLNGEISQGTFDKLKALVEFNREPNHHFIEQCFPEAAREYKKYCTQSQLPNWSFDSVADYWRNYHRHRDKPRDLWKGVVMAIAGDIVEIRANAKIYPTLNVYHLDLRVGNIVTMHKGSIIELLDSTEL